ncbi:DUF4232 domain-containing protein [Streptomyces sp. NPDC056361]|uniref:DUF4232 domain-containing protein n=1 Tax=Streptomyces sp. NPDC056361 TaxID=3345795 RepID=UPI0035DFBD02
MSTSARRTTRTHTRNLRPYAVGAAVAVVLLASTACGPDGDDGAGRTGGSGRPSATTPATPGGTASPQPEDTTTSEPEVTPTAKPRVTKPNLPGSGSDAGTTAIATCTQEQLAVSSELEPPDSKEHRHLLLTVQNVSDKKCNLHRYPHVRLGADSQADTPVIKHTDPDPGKPVTLDPGREGYAALLVSGGHRDEYEATSITLTLQGAETGTHAGSPIDVPLPVAKLHADDGQLVTYWTTAPGFALRAIMSK